MLNITEKQLKQIGELIIASRKTRFPNDTQKKFGRRIGVSNVTIHRIESGTGNVGITAYLTAINTLGLSDKITKLCDTESIIETQESNSW